MTIYDISKEAGVSIATVSRVLNGNASVRPKTKQKVLDVIERLGYTPNAFARGLGLNTMNEIGILCSDSSDIFLAKGIYHIEQRLRSMGYNSLLCCTGYDLSGKEEAMTHLLSKRVDGVILIGSNFQYDTDKENSYLINAASTVPLFLMNADFDYPNVYCSFCDDIKATKEGVNYLINHGSKRILHLYDSDSFSGKRKLTGYQTALIENDMTIDKELMVRYTGSRESVSEIADFLNSLKNNGLSFDAVCASNDYMAMGAIKYARINGLHVPDDFQVLGYNDSVLTTCSDPELSSINNHVDKMATQLVSTLVEVFNEKEPPQKSIVSGELVLRQTTRIVTS